jgi:TolB-like protein/Tfp pilus assembly protein PilF
MSLLSELKRRNVFRVAIAYLALAWLLTEVAGTLFPVFGIPDWGVRFVVALLALGLMPTLVFSWVYELTPEGLKREQDVAREASITRLTAKRLDLFTIAIVVVALIFILVDRMWLAPSFEDKSLPMEGALPNTAQTFESATAGANYPVNSIAVLPFVNMSDDATNEYFADGISEELLNLLSRIPELRVTSRSSSFYFKGKDFRAADVARELNVNHILEGSVRKAGQRVRITAQLIETSTDTHLWSDTYDRTLNDIFAIQDEIAAAVVAELKLTLLGEVPKAEVLDPEAYALYLQAVYIGAQMGPDSMQQSNSLLEQALAIHPDFARAWRLLARNLMVQADIGAVPREEGEKLARQAIDRALAIEPDLAVAHSWLAAVNAGQTNSDLVSAAAQMKHALSLEPTNPDVLSHAAALLDILGRPDEAIAVYEYAVKLDPLNPIIYNNLGWHYLGAGRSKESLSAARTLRRLSPHYGGLNTLEGMALLQMGDYEAALAATLAERPGYWRLICLVKAYHTMGLVEQSDAALTELIQEYGNDQPFRIAEDLAYRNEADRAFEWLERAAENEDPKLNGVAAGSSFEHLHEDPRWLPFLERIGRSPEQLAAIEFEVELPR